MVFTPSVTHGQSQPQTGPAELQTAAVGDSSSVLREIDDPASGARWLLVRDQNDPGAPGRLLLLSASQTLRLSHSQASSLPLVALLPVVVRAGDSLILEEHTARADVRLEAVALGPARAGDAIRARLNLGGSIVRAIVSGPHRATLLSSTEARP